MPIKQKGKFALLSLGIFSWVIVMAIPFVAFPVPDSLIIFFAMNALLGLILGTRKNGHG